MADRDDLLEATKLGYRWLIVHKDHCIPKPGILLPNGGDYGDADNLVRAIRLIKSVIDKEESKLELAAFSSEV